MFDEVFESQMRKVFAFCFFFSTIHPATSRSRFVEMSFYKFADIAVFVMLQCRVVQVLRFADFSVPSHVDLTHMRTSHSYYRMHAYIS